MLCRFEPCASSFIYRGIGTEIQQSHGYKFDFWFPEKNSAFDKFNEFQPDIYLGQGYNLDRAQIKIINQNPNMKVILKVGIWGNIQDESDINNYEMLFASDKEKEDVSSIINPHRLSLFNYHSKSYNDYILGGWIKSGYKAFSLAPVADMYNFYPEYNEKVASDISFIGGYWEWKGKNINKFIINNFCYPIGLYNIKIFGNQHWPCPQFNGIINDNLVRQVISSSKIYPCIHEPQSTRFGFEALSRVFNGIACKSCVISDYVECLHKDFFPNKDLLMFKDPKEYKDCVDYFLNHENERLEYIDKLYNIVIKNHTYKQRVDEILEIIQ